MGGPLRILHVVVNMNRGGAETLLMNLYRNIDRSTIQFDFLTCKEGVFDKEITDLGGKIHRIPYVSEVGHSRYLKVLDTFFQSHHYNIVHSHMDKMSGFVLRAAKKAGVPVRIAHSHNTQSEGGTAAKLYKSYSGSLIRSSANQLFACSNDAAKWLFGSKASKALVLKNGIECDKFKFSKSVRKSVREELGINDDTLVVGHVGRFNHQKNHTYLLNVFAELSKRVPKAVLLLIGDGVLKDNIEEKIKSLNLVEKVVLLGVRGDIHQLLQAFDVFAFPSKHEGLPVTLIEAQAAGLPCIISETITKEVDMEIGLVEYVPLSQKILWIEKITGVKKSRKTVTKALAIKGYDIRKTVRFLEGYYIRLGGTRTEKINNIYSNI